MVTQRRRSKLPASIQEELVKLFVSGATARTAAGMLDINRHTATLYFRKLREIIATHEGRDTPQLAGRIEVDESFFGGRRKGKRGRGAAGKVIVFGLLKRGGKVRTVIVDDTKANTLEPLIKKSVKPHSVVYTDGHKAYNVLDASEFRHRRVNHSKEFVSRQGDHINGLENFWNQAKRHLRRFNGIPREQFPLFLKECEWRFNNRPTAKLLQVLMGWAKEDMFPAI